MPSDLDLSGLEATRAYVHRTLRANRSALGRAVRRHVERVTIATTRRSTFDCGNLPGAIEAVEPPDQVAAVHLEIVHRRRHAVVIDWSAHGPSTGKVRGRNKMWVVGVHGLLQRYFNERGFTTPSARPGRWRQPWMTEVSTQTLATVIGAGLLALIGAVWAFLT